MPEYVPPSEWHPWYRDRLWLAGWLLSEEHHAIVVPVPPTMALRVREYQAAPDETDVTTGEQRLVLTKHRAAGQAPYVGEPFVYAWTFATDQYGRSIATEARIVYTSR